VEPGVIDGIVLHEVVTGDWYLSYLFVYVTLIRNRSENYKLNF